MALFLPTRGAINYGQPVNWRSSFNIGLKAWWLNVPLWRNGQRWIDLCGIHHGTIVNTTAAAFSGSSRPGSFGSLALNTNDEVQVHTIGRQQGEVTIAAWIRPSSLSANDRCIIGDRSGSGAVDFALDIAQTTGLLKWRQGAATLTSTVGVSALQWTHVAASRKGSAGNWTIDFYVNGLYDNSPTTTTNPNSDGSACRIGVNGNNTNLYFDGFIDDLRILNRPLRSGREALHLYNDSRTGYRQTLNRVGGFLALNVAGGGGGFQSAWASGSNVLLRAG